MATSHRIDSVSFAGRAPALSWPVTSVIAAVRRVHQTIAERHRRSVERAALRCMSYEMQQDLGASRVHEEMHKPDWML